MRFFEQHIPSRFFGIPNLVIFGLSFAGMLAADGQEVGMEFLRVFDKHEAP